MHSLVRCNQHSRDGLNFQGVFQQNWPIPDLRSELSFWTRLMPDSPHSSVSKSTAIGAALAHEDAQHIKENARPARPYCSGLAAAIWLLSLCLPTFHAESKTVIGVEVALQFISPWAWLLAPTILVISSFTNVIFLLQVGRLARAGRPRTKAPTPAPIAVALLINLIACFSIVGTPSYRALLPGLFTSPGVWFWLASFVLLLVGIMRGESAGPPHHANLSARRGPCRP
jgi:hypothetical protein